MWSSAWQTVSGMSASDRHRFELLLPWTAICMAVFRWARWFSKDCGSVYRTVYKMTMCLPTWTTWLQKNRLDYLGILLAYVSLKKEGIGSVAADRIEARREYLKWLFATCGYPFPFGYCNASPSIVAGTGVEVGRRLRLCLNGFSSSTCSDASRCERRCKQ